MGNSNFGWSRSVALMAVLVLALAPAATAQRATGDLNVVTLDNQGEALPGVTVTITGQGAPRVQVTNSRGQAFFPGIDPGRVELKAELEGFSTVEYPAVVIGANRSTSIEVSLSPAVEEVITVTSESPLLDEKKIQQGTTISQVELEKIPTARDPWAVLAQTPGVNVDRINVGGNESGQQSVFLGPGVSDDENSFMVDGVEITDMAAIGASPSYYDFDQFTEMQFSTGGTDVSKVSSGVSVNLVTKRGTNEFRGSARFNRTDDDMFDVFRQDVAVFAAGDPDLGPNQRGFVGNSINQVTEYGFEAGGPLLRDKIWFWGSFGTNDIRNRTGGTTLAQVQSDDTILENTAFKFNAQLSGSNSAVGSWNNGDKQKFGRNASPFRPRPTTWNQRGPTAIIKFEDTHVFASNFFLGGTYSKVDGGFSLTSIGTVQSGNRALTPETQWGADGIWQNSWLEGGTSRPAEEWKLDGSYFFNTGDAAHELKFGARMRDFEVVSPFAWPGRDLYHVDGVIFGEEDPTRDIVVFHRGITPPVTQEYTSFWAQDTISLGNLTVNAGFRYDVQDGRNEAFSIAANPALPELLPELTFGGEDAPFDWTTISPRVGLTYALGEERKTLLRASFSRFPEQLSTGNIVRTNPLGDAYATYVFSDSNGNNRWDEGETLLELSNFAGFDPTDPDAVVSPNRTDPGLDPSLTDELIVGVEHAVLPEFVVGANVTLRRTTDVLETRTILADGRLATAADYVLDGFLTGTLPDGTPYSAPLYGLVPDRSGGFFLFNGDREVNYEGINVTFVKRLANRWMLRGYFNFGEGEWDVPASYIANQDPTNTVPATSGAILGLVGDADGELFAVPAAGSGAKSNVFIQSSWQYNINGMYQVAPDRPWGFNVAANVFGREGTPLPAYHVSTSSGGVTKAVQVVDDLDDFRSDDILTVDARIEKEFAATGNVGFAVSVDAFNLFDESYVLQRFRQANSSSQNNLTETLSPRIWRIGVRLNWR